MELGERRQDEPENAIRLNRYNASNRNNGVVYPCHTPWGGPGSWGTTSVVPLVPIPVTEFQSPMSLFVPRNR